MAAILSVRSSVKLKFVGIVHSAVDGNQKHPRPAILYAVHSRIQNLPLQIRLSNVRHEQGPLLLTWFKFNPSMDK